jgi:amidase
MRAGLVKQAHRDAWREMSIKFFTDNSIDLLLTPALAAPPPLAERYSSASWRRNMSVNVNYAPYAAPWNVAGLPAIVVPVGLRPDGLPLAIQLVGPPDSELLLLAVAGQFEVLNPWQRHAFV